MSRTLKDIGVCLAIMAVAGVVYWESLKLRPGTYDPLGSGTMPRMVAIGLIVLCLVAIMQAVLAGNLHQRRAPLIENDEFERRPRLAVAVFGFLIVAAILLALKLPFGITGSLMVFVTVMAIKKGDRSVIIPAIVLALIFGFGLTYLFGNIFNVDLP